jgi:hypothetical protein
MSSARSEGVWNLTLLAGVQTYEVFITHFLWCLCQCTIVIIENILTFSWAVPEMKIFDHFWIIFFLLVMLAIEFILFEFWISLLVIDFKVIFFVNIYYMLSMVFLGGVFW